ncbi:hypothetical protein Tco_0954191 [Tanacetum coccineum]|uniref:Uncharacterized protein n=1 Tax=Tanacetum coccineum TaxID=301880 RepID=A0ABQ5E212_9ASTR
MNEQSRYKQVKTKTRQSINVKSHIFNVKGDNDKSKQNPTRMSSVVRRSLKKETSTLGEIVSLNYIKSNMNAQSPRYAKPDPCRKPIRLLLGIGVDLVVSDVSGASRRGGCVVEGGMFTLSKMLHGEMGGKDSSEESANEIDDVDNSDMDLTDDEPKGDDATARYGNRVNETPVKELTDLMSNQVYIDAHITSAVHNPEGNPEITKALNAQDAESSFHKRSHNDQDPPNDHEGEKREKQRKDFGQSSSRLSRQNKSHVVHAQDDTPVIQPLDQEDEYIRTRPNPEQYTKSGSAGTAKRRMTWFNLLLKSDIDQNENHILRPLTVAIANKLKALI